VEMTLGSLIIHSTAAARKMPRGPCCNKDGDLPSAFLNALMALLLQNLAIYSLLPTLASLLRRFLTYAFVSPMICSQRVLLATTEKRSFFIAERRFTIFVYYTRFTTLDVSRLTFLALAWPFLQLYPARRTNLCFELRWISLNSCVVRHVPFSFFSR